MKSNIVRFTAKVLILVMASQLILPATKSFALTTGPSQPEVQSFEPVGTTEMVDLFSGDFVYNIPLMDIEGYPINIAYHSGVTMEQEASWVGLGWNINPGEISRGVRGVPDDFNGDTLIKKLNIKPEQDYRFRFGIEVGFEVFGFAHVGIPLGTSLTYNNYKGVGIITDASVTLGTGHSLPFSSAQLGMGITVGSQTGATVDADAAVNFGTSKDIRESNGTISLSGSTGYNSRSGLTAISLNTKAGLQQPYARTQDVGYGFGSTIPIGLQNYVPVITNASTMNAGSFKLDVGFEGEGTFESMSFTLSSSNLSYDPNGSRKSYGYLFEQNANDSAIMDFTRANDGIYNSSMTNLPLSSMTYDIYSITGQGTGGMFRPFRNDIGSVFDPTTAGQPSNTNDLNFEAGVGEIFEFGTDYTRYTTKAVSGPWYRKNFKSNNTGSLFENTYFKQAGEMTYSMQQDNPTVASHAPVMVSSDNKFHGKGGGTIASVPDYYGNTLSNRTARANHLSYLSNSESAITGIGTMPQLESYPRNTFINNNNSASVTIKKSNRSGTKITDDKAGHIGEMTQVLPDGKRYVYGLPAVNHLQKEVTFAVKNSNANLANGTVKFSNDDKISNGNGIDHYYQATYTPAYAHSYLLTQVLTPDYTDVTGDGPTEDDLGSYTKFNYTRTDSDFRWVAPIEAAKNDGTGNYSAQYNPGFWSDTMDDKGSYTVGSRDNYYVHSIESKNMVAEFYTSPRNDAEGARKRVVDAADITIPATYMNGLGTDKTASTYSYKLDSIVLYNKHDRILNGTSAVPIKTVIFKYDYQLCSGVPNYEAGIDPFLTSGAPTGGKLTLKRIYFRYGTSAKSVVNPYVFTYSSNNLGFNSAAKDRWGNYKPTDASITNYEFPYVKQDSTEANLNAPAWNLTGIKLPSGGNLSIQYEADDYSYVQDKRTMEMTRIAGIGSGPTYDPKDILYEDENKPYDYIYFTRSKGREIKGRTLRQNYLENESLLYFSFNVDLAAKNSYEHISGYADIDSVGYCGGDTSSNYGFVKIKLASAGGSSGNMMNPVTLAALNVGRYYLPQIIYPGYSNGSLTGPLTVLNALRQAAKELFTITGNVNVNFMKKGLAKKFVPAKSWIRLNTPGYTKIGGGSRVRTLKLDDDWADMASNGSTASYGQNYDYTTLLDNSVKISSGVASYEPMIGGDEIPQHMPVKYTASDGHLMPAIEFNQQEPFGESLYPCPSVGYSKVTVTSINKDIARSSKSKTVQEYYTAKDFPIETDFTEKNVPVDKHQHSLVTRYDEVNALQGYVIKMNDMHGKPKAISNYVIHKSPSSGVETDELITSTKYNYQTQNGKLYNQVRAVKRGSLVRPTYSITDMVLGEETDFSIDNRSRDEDTKNFTVSFNLNTIGFGIFVIPIPTVFFPDTHEESVMKTMVATKVIQQYGILKSIETVDHGARSLSENELWDSETGQVILTKTNNEYNDPINNLSIPAYWSNDRMGPTYFNAGYEEVFDSVYVDQNGYGYLLGAIDNRNYNLGDELLIKLNGQNYRVWITDMKAPPPLPGTSVTDNGTPCNPLSVPVFSPRAIYPSGDGVTFWIPNTQGYRNVYLKVIRPGRRNILDRSIASTSFAGAFNPVSMTNLFGGFTNVINATANTYTEYATNDEFVFGGSLYTFNNYILGKNGNFRDQSSYTYKAPRTYTGNNRNSGYYDFSQQNLYNYFIQPFQPTTDNSACSLEDVILGSGPSSAFWRNEKQETIYNAYGLPVEETNAAGIYSTAVYGYNHALPVALGSNIKYGQLKYLNFEDLLEIQQYNRSVLGIWDFLQPGPMPTNFKYHNGLKYGIIDPGSFAMNTSVTTDASHTGKYSMLFSGAGKIRLGAPQDYTGVPYCYVSMWVKPVSGAISTSSMFLEGQGTSSNITAVQDFTAFTVKTNSIDGWYKLEGKITMSLLANYLNIYLSMPAGYYVDDIRFYPDGGNMKSFAYDVSTMRLMGELDENNFATFYEYDQEGVLIRVKKESDRGILTVNENRKSNAKNIQ